MTYRTFSSDIKNVFSHGLIKNKKNCDLLLLPLSCFCACFASLVTDMDQNILDRSLYQNHLIEHGVSVLSAVEGLSHSHLFSACDCASLLCSRAPGSNMHHSSSNSSMADDKNRGVAVEKLENMKKWGINTYKVAFFWMTKNSHRENRAVWCLTVCVLVAVVYKTNDLRALRPRFPDRGPGAGGPDRSAAGH